MSLHMWERAEQTHFVSLWFNRTNWGECKCNDNTGTLTLLCPAIHNLMV